MSEYQFIHFLAIDRPLNDKQLDFMRRQSTRAEITPWEFTNEYHWGDFHGNAREMLRRGYDVHLHYANFGIRRLMMRLPAGLPCDRRTFNAFRVPYSLEWHADRKGRGGILEIEPQGDSDMYSEGWYDADGLLPDIAPVRNLLIGGDLRPLYLAWLACRGEDEAGEPPVPAGLGKLPPALEAMAELYELSENLLAAAAERSPPLPKSTGAAESLEQWLAWRSRDDLRDLVRRFLAEDTAATRAETLSRIRAETGAATWPLAEPTRTWAELREAARRLHDERQQREQRAREAAHRRRLTAIAADPRKAIAKVRQLVNQRSTDSYEQAARELVELREALGEKRGPARARAVAEKLRRDNPRYYRLISALRKHGLLD
jgi:hypothetical protein